MARKSSCLSGIPAIHGGRCLNRATPRSNNQKTPRIFQLLRSENSAFGLRILDTQHAQMSERWRGRPFGTISDMDVAIEPTGKY